MGPVAFRSRASYANPILTGEVASDRLTIAGAAGPAALDSVRCVVIVVVELCERAIASSARS